MLLSMGMNAVHFQPNHGSETEVGLQSELCELALTALAEWSGQLNPKGGTTLASHDLCRFSQLVMRLVETCKFDVEDPQSYNSHQQIGRLLSDLCTQNASILCSMPSAELTQLWLALLRLLRYPAAVMQVDALTGMVALARQKIGIRINLEELLGVLHVLSLKNNDAEKREISIDRSNWLLRCLGPISSSQNCERFRDWCYWMKVSASFDILEADFSGQQIQSQRLGMVKVHSKELLQELSRKNVEPSGASGSTVASSDGNFETLCRVAGGLLARALAGDVDDMNGSNGGAAWVEECDSAMSLVESAATATLKLAEKESKELLDKVLHQTQTFLQQVCVKTEVNPAIEHRKLEFFSACSGFYKHWPENVLRDVLARVLAHLREGPLFEAQKKGIKLEQRALDTLVAISKSGVLKAQHLESLNGECHDLAQRVSSASGRSNSDSKEKHVVWWALRLGLKRSELTGVSRDSYQLPATSTKNRVK